MIWRFFDIWFPFSLFRSSPKNPLFLSSFLQAGFNIGEGRGFTKAFNSKTLYQAHNYYGSDVKGRYIYRIDTEKVVRGGCEKNILNTGSISFNNYKLHIDIKGRRGRDRMVVCYIFSFNNRLLIDIRGRHGHDRVVVGFTIYAKNANHH